MNDNPALVDRITTIRLIEQERHPRHHYPSKRRPSGRHAFAQKLRWAADRIEG
jgi:hypothetical protein